MGRHGQSLLRHDHAHSQVSAPVLPAPQFTQFLLERFVRYRGQPLLKLGSLFSPRHSRSLGRLLATYLLTCRAPGQREKATYLLFGTTGPELRSSSKNQTQERRPCGGRGTWVLKRTGHASGYHPPLSGCRAHLRSRCSPVGCKRPSVGGL